MIINSREEEVCMLIFVSMDHICTVLVSVSKMTSFPNQKVLQFDVLCPEERLHGS